MKIWLSLKRVVEPRLFHAHRYISKIFADSFFVTLAGLLTGGLRELYLTYPPMSWNDCMHSRMVAAVFDLVFAALYGSIRDHYVRKIRVKNKFLYAAARAGVVTIVFALFWGVLYAINITFISRVEDISESLVSFVAVALSTVWFYDVLFRGNRELTDRLFRSVKSLFRRK